jgi:hypothetical protein
MIILSDRFDLVLGHACCFEMERSAWDFQGQIQCPLKDFLPPSAAENSSPFSPWAWFG